MADAPVPSEAPKKRGRPAKASRAEFVEKQKKAGAAKAQGPLEKAVSEGRIDPSMRDEPVVRAAGRGIPGSHNAGGAFVPRKRGAALRNTRNVGRSTTVTRVNAESPGDYRDVRTTLRGGAPAHPADTGEGKLDTVQGQVARATYIGASLRAKPGTDVSPEDRKSGVTLYHEYPASSSRTLPVATSSGPVKTIDAEQVTHAELKENTDKEVKRLSEQRDIVSVTAETHKTKPQDPGDRGRLYDPTKPVGERWSSEMKKRPVTVKKIEGNPVPTEVPTKRGAVAGGHTTSRLPSASSKALEADKPGKAPVEEAAISATSPRALTGAPKAGATETRMLYPAPETNQVFSRIDAARSQRRAEATQSQTERLQVADASRALRSQHEAAESTRLQARGVKAEELLGASQTLLARMPSPLANQVYQQRQHNARGAEQVKNTKSEAAAVVRTAASPVTVPDGSGGRRDNPLNTSAANTRSASRLQHFSLSTPAGHTDPTGGAPLATQSGSGRMETLSPSAEGARSRVGHFGKGAVAVRNSGEDDRSTLYEG